MTTGSPTTRSAPDATPFHDPYLGRTFLARYQLEERIGRGGMGIVYRALDLEESPPCEVVVKVLAAQSMDPDTALERFSREARSLQRLEHPNTVRIFDFDRDGADCFLVMEYVDGVRLDALVESEGRLDLDVFSSIALQMLDSLDEAHALHVLHRDLKPSNVVLTRRPKVPFFPKVLDFGLVKFLDERSDLTGPHNLVGSVSYVSPEHVLGHTIDQRADVYALGILFHYMLTGARPYEGSQTQILYGHLHKDPPSVNDALPPDAQVPDALARLLCACLAKEPRDRPRDAAALAGRLRDALGERIASISNERVDALYETRGEPVDPEPSSDPIFLRPETSPSRPALDPSILPWSDEDAPEDDAPEEEALEAKAPKEEEPQEQQPEAEPAAIIPAAPTLPTSPPPLSSTTLGAIGVFVLVVLALLAWAML